MKKPEPCYEWLIVGGGPHGLALAGALVKAARFDHSSLAIVDAGPAPLWAWRKRAANCGMLNLRSDIRYHLDCWPQAVPYTLAEWAATQLNSDYPVCVLDKEFGHIVASTRLFDAHCNWFINDNRLGQFWQQGLVTRLVRMNDERGWQICLSDGSSLNSRRVVLATGPGQLNYPRWSQAIEPVYHLSNLQQHRADWQNFSHITVIGGALTSANFVLEVSRQKRSSLPEVTLLLRSPLKTSILEANLSALTCEFQNRFKQSDYSTRRALITQSRANGTIPAQVRDNLLKTGAELVQAEVVQASCHNSRIKLQLSNDIELETDAVVLGTGFVRGGWSNKLVMQVAQDYQISLSECGYAMPSPNLEWLPGLYLMGGEAELELGPICRNLAGAGLGVARIMSSFDVND